VADQNERLEIFLCHASEDKGEVRSLLRTLTTWGHAPWLDEERILPGQDWEREIRNALTRAHIVLVCISSRSERKGFVQKELRRALDIADEQPDGTIFIIPVKLEPCAVPERLRKWQWVELFSEGGEAKLAAALEAARTGPAGPTPPQPHKLDATTPRAPTIVLDWPYCTPAEDELGAFLSEAAYRKNRGDSPCGHVRLASLDATERAVADINGELEPNAAARTKRIELLRELDYLREIQRHVQRAIEFMVDDDARRKTGWWAIPTNSYANIVMEVFCDRKTTGTVHAWLANNQDQMSAWIYFSVSGLEEIVGHRIAERDFLSITDLPIPIELADLDSSLQHRCLGIMLRKLVERNLDPLEKLDLLQKSKWVLSGD